MSRDKEDGSAVVFVLLTGLALAGISSTVLSSSSTKDSLIENQRVQIAQLESTLGQCDAHLQGFKDGTRYGTK